MTLSPTPCQPTPSLLLAVELSSLKGAFDPLGFLAPDTIQGRALLGEITVELSDWDMPLLEDKLSGKPSETRSRT